MGKPNLLYNNRHIQDEYTALAAKGFTGCIMMAFLFLTSTALPLLFSISIT
jgi:hypothetical protein